MTTYSDMINMLGGVPVAGGLGDAALAGGKWYFCDPTHGSASNDGLTPQTAKASLLTCYNLTRDGYNDGVVFMGGATAWNPAAMLTWSNNYTHLIGTNSMPGLGNRCRIVSLAADALTVPVTFSGSGCYVKNLQINNETAAGSATGCAIVTGLRNVFENVFFMAPTSPTAASYSCKLGSAENAFINCTFGQLTNFRSAATYGLWMHGVGNVSRNKFVNCEWLAWSGGSPSTHVHILFDADMAAVPIMTKLVNPMFINNFGGGTIQAQAIDDNCTAAGHQIILEGDYGFVGCTATADVVTYLFTRAKFAGGLMAAISES
jgi:hypothetical protein